MMLLEIGIALLLARLLGYAFEKIKQPAVIGEILSGIIIGPFIMGEIFDMKYLSPETEGIAQLGIVFLLFMSGLEIGIEEIKTVGRSGLVTAVFGAIFSFFFGYIVGYAMGYDMIVSVAIGNIFVATSVGITVRTLVEMHALHSKVGELILAGAVLDDVIGIIILSVTLGQGEPLMLFAKMLIFFCLIYVIAFLYTKDKGN